MNYKTKAFLGRALVLAPWWGFGLFFLALTLSAFGLKILLLWGTIAAAFGLTKLGTRIECDADAERRAVERKEFYRRRDIPRNAHDPHSVL